MDAHRQGLMAALAALLLGACSSPSTPTTELPDLTGAWRNPPLAWRWSETYTYSPGTVGSTACDGELVIDIQRGSAFEGRYEIECSGGVPSSGRLLDGTVAADGLLSFRLLPEQGWSPDLGPTASRWETCTGSGEPAVFEGSFLRDVITARRVEPLTCPDGIVTVATRFQGAREPSSRAPVTTASPPADALVSGRGRGEGGPPGGGPPS